MHRSLPGLAALCLVIFASLAQAADAPPALPAGSFALQLKVMDSDTSQPLKAHVISLSLSGEHGEARMVLLVSDAGTISLPLESGKWRIIATIDSQDTPGNDYFGILETDLRNDSGLTLFMMPVGSISGLVLFENRTVSDAQISLKCPSQFYDMGAFYKNVRSDGFGSFGMNSVPAKNCELFASSNGKNGVASLGVRKGGFSNVRINLSQLSQPDEKNYGQMLLIGAAIILAAIGFAAFMRRRQGIGKDTKANAIEDRMSRPKGPSKVRQAASSSPKPSEAGGIKATPKMKAILETLSENERKIAIFLIENNGKSRQNRIYYALLIPKVSLSRAVFSLENKNIIKTKRFGKVKEIELSEWFLG